MDGPPVGLAKEGDEAANPEDCHHDDQHRDVKDQVVLVHGIVVNDILAFIELAGQLKRSLIIGNCITNNLRVSEGLNIVKTYITFNVLDTVPLVDGQGLVGVVEPGDVLDPAQPVWDSAANRFYMLKLPLFIV